MKKKFWLILLATVSALCLLCGLSACGDGDEHEHTWATEWSSSAEGHFHYATCEGHETVKDEVLPHIFEEGECTVCHYPDPNAQGGNDDENGLKFEKNPDGQSYRVAGVGRTFDKAQVEIPAQYEGLPVTAIGEDAFSDLEFLTSISFPESVTAIGDWAFLNCTSLASIHFPENILTIGKWAFSNCSSLVEIEIPESVTSIGIAAFAECTSLTKINWNATDCELEEWSPLFENCTADAAVIFGENVQSIPANAFGNFAGLKSVTFEGIKNLVRIEEGAFRDCPALESVYITDIEAWCSIEFCGEEPRSNPLSYGATFYVNGSPVTELEELPGVTAIGRYVFAGSAFTRVTIPENVTEIGDGSFYGCRSLIHIELHGNVTSVAENAFADCPIEDASIPVSAIDKIPHLALKNLRLVSGDRIGEYAFYDHTKLESVWIGASVTEIERMAFDGCTSLESVTFEENSNLGKIAFQAFHNCISLKAFPVPESVTEIENGAFGECSSLKSVYITDLRAWCSINIDGPDANPLVNGAALYLDGEPVTDLDGLTGITEIKGFTFYGCTSLTNVTIPEGVTTLKSWSFYGCTSLVTLVLSEGVTKLEGNLFQGCTRLKNIYWNAENVLGGSYYGSGDGSLPFTNCTTSAAVVFGNNVQSIPWRALYGFAGLKSVTIGSGVRFIDQQAFSACSALESIEVEQGNQAYRAEGNCLIEIESGALIAGCKTSVIPNDGSVKTIRTDAFYLLTSLESIIIPKGVTDIDAFHGCSALTSITIPESVTAIGMNAFQGCSSLEKVYYGGVQTQWDEIFIQEGNTELTSATRYYFSEVTPTAEQWASHDYWWRFDPETSLPTPWVKENQ